MSGLKLKAKIIENGFNLRSFSEKIKVNRHTIYRWIENNSIPFKRIKTIVDALELTKEEYLDIFFDNEV